MAFTPLNLSGSAGGASNFTPIGSSPTPTTRQPLSLATVLHAVSGGIQAVFPGQKVGQAIGTLGGYGITAAKERLGLVPKGTTSRYDLSAPSPFQVAGDIASGAALIGGFRLPAARTVVGAAAQLGGLSAISGAGGTIASGGSAKDIFKSAILSGTIGAALGAGTRIFGKGINALTKNAPAKIYNTAIKSSLPDTKAAIKYGGRTLGEELVDRGVTGGDRKLFQTALSKISTSEEKLQTILTRSQQTISREEIAPYLDKLIATKQATPGLASDVEVIKGILNEYPNQIPIAQANQIKRNLYNALTDTAFRIDPTLSTKREVMKAIAKGIKSEIEKKTASEVGQGVVQSINKDLAVYGKLQDRALDKIARANRNNLLGLGDYVAIGSGAATGVLTGGSALIGGAAMEALKRTLGSTAVMTNSAVAFSKLGMFIDKLPTDSAGKISKALVVGLINQLSRSQR